MFGAANNPSQLYQHVSIETSVNSASSHRLIEMLFEAADAQLVTVITAIEEDNPALKGESITRVIRIIDEGLRASLNPQAGELAERLASIYDYCLRQLLEANCKNSIEIIEHVRSLIGEIHEGWSGIAERVLDLEVAAA
ncbi:MAG: flagellar export chaperone FliS [Burkholderiaceae bacterium]